METITLKVEGMSCDHCVRSVQKALESVEGVTYAEVDLRTAAATVSLNPPTDMGELQCAVHEAGYSLEGAPA